MGKHSDSIQFEGRKRVIITNPQPLIDNGRYIAKSAIGEVLPVSADIFCDGHQELAASVLLGNGKGQKSREIPMKFVGNDKWVYEFTTDQTGIYQFKIIAWVDHFRTWKKNIAAKLKAGIDVSLELKMGIVLLIEAADGSKATEKKIIERYIKALSEDSDTSKLAGILKQDDIDTVMRGRVDKKLATQCDKVLTVEVERKKAAFSTWYELFPRSTANEGHGSFKDVERLLPRIAEMGFDVLYFPPIHPIGEKHRKGRNNSLIALPDDPGSPWAVGSNLGGHKDIHPELGDLSDFKHLIKAASKLGIDIAMDIAFQCAPDHPYVKEHPQWFKWRPDGTVQYAENPPKKYEDILPLDFESERWEELWHELRSVILYWIKQGITVFRIDNPHTKAFAFWEWAITEIRKDHPEVIFLAEAFTRPRPMEQLAKAGFNQSYTYFTWRNTKKEIETYLTELTKTELRYFFRPNFWPSTPDILPPELTAGGENAHIMRLILAATLSSNYGIYGPVYEFGLNTPMHGKEEYIDNEKYEIKHWDWDKTTRIREVVRLMNRIRKEHPALQTTWNIEFIKTDNDQLIAYIKKDERVDDILIIIVNLDPHHVQSGQVDIPFDMIPLHDYKVYDLLSKEQYNWKSGWNYVRLDPNEMPAHILQLQPNA